MGNMRKPARGSIYIIRLAGCRERSAAGRRLVLEGRAQTELGGGAHSSVCALFGLREGFGKRVAGRSFCGRLESIKSPRRDIMMMRTRREPKIGQVRGETMERLIAIKSVGCLLLRRLSGRRRPVGSTEDACWRT